MIAWDAVTAAIVARATIGSSAQEGRHVEERIHRRLGLDEQKRPLAEVVQDRCRRHDHEPGQPNRCRPEMADVGIERLASGDDEKDGAKDNEAGSAGRGTKKTQRRALD